MKLRILIAAVLLIMLGNLGFVSALHQTPVKVSGLAMGVLFVVWGALLLWYRAKSYRGGAATIIGALLLGMSAYTLLENIFWAVPTTPKEAFIQISVLVVLAVAGSALVKQGHKMHRLTHERISADT